jgi:hypothetical protein
MEYGTRVENKYAYKILNGKQRNKPLRTPTRTWNYNIEMYLREI